MDRSTYDAILPAIRDFLNEEGISCAYYELFKWSENHHNYPWLEFRITKNRENAYNIRIGLSSIESFLNSGELYIIGRCVNRPGVNPWSDSTVFRESIFDPESFQKLLKTIKELKHQHWRGLVRWYSQEIGLCIGVIGFVLWLGWAIAYIVFCLTKWTL